MTKVLITGGAGYLGCMLVNKIGHDAEVTVVDNFLYGQTPFLDQCYADNQFLTIVRKDYRQLHKSFYKNFDVIIHLAAIVGAPACDKNINESCSVNQLGVFGLLGKLNKDQVFIFPCTNSGYGVGQESQHCTEESTLNPVSEYGKQKVAAELAVLAFGGISLRFATLFGASPKMRLDLLVNDFVYRAVTDKFLVLFEAHFKRNYIHVRDAAKACWHSFNNFKTMRGNAYNVGLSSANLSKLELANKIKEHIPELAIIQSEVNKDLDQRNYVVSNEKIEKTGFMPEYSLDSGIQELMQAYQIINRNQFTNL